MLKINSKQNDESHNQEEQMTNFKKRLPIISLVLGEKKFLINSNFQIQFIASLMLISFISMSIIYLANDYFFHSYIVKGQALNLPPDHPFFLMIHEQKKFMTNVFITVALSISSIACVWGLFYSHKIAGPLHRLQRYFTQAATESEQLKNKIFFREDDFFQEVPESINLYIDSIQSGSRATSTNDEAA